MRHLMETWKNYIAEIQSEESKIVSFDFDDTLALEDSEYHYVGPNRPLLGLFKLFQRKGYNVYIVTSRSKENEDLPRKNPNVATVDEFLAEHGLNQDGIFFTHPQDKVHTLREQGVILHFDDDEFELGSIDTANAANPKDPQIGTVRINFETGAMMSGQEHIQRLLGDGWAGELTKLDDEEKENDELDG